LRRCDVSVSTAPTHRDPALFASSEYYSRVVCAYSGSGSDETRGIGELGANSQMMLIFVLGAAAMVTVAGAGAGAGSVCAECGVDGAQPIFSALPRTGDGPPRAVLTAWWRQICSGGRCNGTLLQGR